MARVGVIVVSYRTDPEPLVTSVASSQNEVRWYIFAHGQDAGLQSKLHSFATSTSARYYPYGVNRGLARSWNEGLLASFGDGNDATIILNDDLSFYDGGFDQFVDFIMSEKHRVPDFGVIMTQGLENEIVRGEASPRRVLTLGACFAIGEGAINRVGYFDENFWPAYFEDFDYHYRLGLAAAPLLCDERTLLEHQRSATVRRDRMLALLHRERLLRNEQYYVRKWGGPPDKERFVNPFNAKTYDFYIPAQRRAAPFGELYDRTDLGSSASLGFLEGSFNEELLAILYRHGATARRCLQWGGGDSTALMAEYARSQDAELFLSIDDVADRLRQVATNIPKYRFLHFRYLNSQDTSEPGDDGRPGSSYICYPLGLGVQFDVILITGRWRMECALLAPSVLSTDGLVIVHDEERAHHRAMRQLLTDNRIGSSGDSIAVLGEWEEARSHALGELYDVVERQRQFLVLRPKRRQVALRQGRGATA